MAGLAGNAMSTAQNWVRANMEMHFKAACVLPMVHGLSSRSWPPSLSPTGPEPNQHPEHIPRHDDVSPFGLGGKLGKAFRDSLEDF